MSSTSIGVPAVHAPASVWQRVLPLNLEWVSTSRQERRADISSWVVLMAAIDPLLKNGLMPALMSLTVTLARPEGGLGWFPSGLPVPVQLLLAAAIAEFGQYWMHRAAHGQGWLWSVHTMHHSPTHGKPVTHTATLGKTWCCGTRCSEPTAARTRAPPARWASTG